MLKGAKKMKATGLVRRIDDLGRVVIPKEIRRSLRIKDGDALEIFTDDGQVIFQKYRAGNDIPDILADLVVAVEEVTDNIPYDDQNRKQALELLEITKAVKKELEKVFQNI